MQRSLPILCLLSCHAFAQQVPSTVPEASKPAIGSVRQSIEVTTTEPMPLSADLERSIVQFDTQEKPLLFNNAVDYLRLDPAVNIEARASNGVQADVSIRGTTFEQTLVLVNGLRVNDVETGHLNLDIPLPLEAVSRIDVLHGSGSTFYGSDAIGGAINFITERPPADSILVKAGFGSHGYEEQHLAGNLSRGIVAESLTGSRDVSDGFEAGGSNGRGYHANALASETWISEGSVGSTDILMAGSDRPYGANQFYGPYDSWERTKGWFGSVQQQIGVKTAFDAAYLRHTDLFVLFNGHPEIYENNHVSTSWEAALRRADNMGAKSSLSYGLEGTGDQIASSNLGRHGRNQGAGYANFSMQVQRFSLTAGAREEIFSGGDSVFSPNVAAAFAVTKSLRVRGSAGHGFRLPTYVDLYYSDPTTIGNPALKPESSWSYEGGVDWTGSRFAVNATGFRLNQSGSIDYSKYSLAAPWQANNVDRLNLSGAEVGVRVRVNGTQQVQLGYTAVQGAPPPSGLISEYAYNYAAQKAVFEWSGEWRQISARTEVGVVQKTGHTAYPVWDLAIARSAGRFRPYGRLLNLSNTGYQEIPAVPVEGRTVVAGIAYTWTRLSK